MARFVNKFGAPAGRPATGNFSEGVRYVHDLDEALNVLGNEARNKKYKRGRPKNRTVKMPTFSWGNKDE